MSLTHKQTESVILGDRSQSLSVTQTGDQRTSYEVDIADDASDYLVNMNIDITQLKSLWISADQALKLETNNADTPDDTITLVADEPVMWHNGSKHSCPLTADVTALYVTNDPAVAAVLKIEVLEGSEN